MIVGVETAGLLAALHAVCFPPGDCWDKAAMRELTAMPGCFGVVRMRGDAPLGFALVRIAADEAEVLTLGVLPDWRRRGEGGALVGMVRDAAVARGATRLFLEVATANQAALSLYRSCGFVEIGRRRRYYPDGGDALVLALSVG
jgi:ribosomal-protein-alanine N-acetyltransferase